MPQSLAQIYVHIIFSTKGRRPFLRDPTTNERLHAYLVGALKGQQCSPLQVGGAEDHVHLLTKLGKTIDAATLVREIKKESTKWLKADMNLQDFHWQSGYGAFSISPSHIESVTQYIQNQQEHHKNESFKDEFRRLCQKYRAGLDERYVRD